MNTGNIFKSLFADRDSLNVFPDTFFEISYDLIRLGYQSKDFLKWKQN